MTPIGVRGGRWLLGGCVVVALSCTLTLGWVAYAVPRQPRTTNDGVYTPQQAQRGEKLYRQRCAECHQPDQYKGYLRRWVGLPVSFFYDIVRSTMPQNNPGGLNRQEYADVLTYVFAINGTPSGDEEMGSEPEDLDAITIVAPPEDGTRR
jgi:mono/diheme cytochrome c family protein